MGGEIFYMSIMNIYLCNCECDFKNDEDFPRLPKSVTEVGETIRVMRIPYLPTADTLLDGWT